MLDIQKRFRGRGYLIESSESDTTNIVCRRGHVYADGGALVAAVNGATRSERLRLAKLGEIIMDGDDGELSVKFPPAAFPAVARVMKPRQSILAAA